MGNFKLGLGIWDIILEGTGNERRVMPLQQTRAFHVFLLEVSLLLQSAYVRSCQVHFRTCFFCRQAAPIRNLLKLHSDGSQFSGKPLSPFSVEDVVGVSFQSGKQGWV